MQYKLFDYQRKAATQVLQRIGWCRDDWATKHLPTSFALSAVTGSGKTVIATAVIEALFYGSTDLDVTPDPKATFLWVTDDPALNRQTLGKMRAASDLVDDRRLVTIEPDFTTTATSLDAGHVYFLNIQKLAKNQPLVNRSEDRPVTIWEVLANTITGAQADLYLVLDEAHRGMKQTSDRPTIVRRIINGEKGASPPAPIVWGISATIERFQAAMTEAGNGRTRHPSVTVDTDKVRISGIIKDQIDLDEPDELGDFTNTLLREAVDATLDFQGRWASYAEAENEPLVRPVMVVQLADKPSTTHLHQLVAVIESQWSGLDKHAVVNVFGEHADLVIGERNVRYVSPEAIQGNDDIRVVLAKTAISTGWDCPRAEVLYSERTAKDATSIAQLIGRMVRSPLAMRIPTDDALNAVTCLLPHFDRVALDKITKELTAPGELGEVVDIVVSAHLFERNAMLHDEVFEFVEALPSWPQPDALASPLRRAKALIQLLTDDNSGSALMPAAGEAFDATIYALLDGLAAQHKQAVAESVANIETVAIRRTSLSAGGETLATSTRTAETALADIDQDTRKIVNSVREGVGKGYLAYRVRDADDDADELTIRTEVAALLLVDGVIRAIEEAAEKWVQDRLSEFAVEIKNTTGATKASYMRVKEQASKQEEASIEVPTTLKAGTKESNKSDAPDLPRFIGHLFADESGSFPAKLNDWERTVIETELDRPSFVAWYRNPSRAGGSALRIGYEDEGGKWGSLQVDFIVISRRTDGQLAASIVDPHGDYLGDAWAKLRALADYAERFGDRFVRIESIAKASNGTLRKLDLLNNKARQAVRSFAGGKVSVLYESAASEDYK
jgi:type III restriction enzyme